MRLDALAEQGDRVFVDIKQGAVIISPHNVRLNIIHHIRKALAGSQILHELVKNTHRQVSVRSCKQCCNPS